MAAILCESFGKLLQGSCEACGTVLTLPCKACGCACEQVTRLCRSPFCLFLSVAVGLNVPPIAFSFVMLGTGQDSEECISASNWLNIDAILSLINILAAMYICLKITHEQKDDSNSAPFVLASVNESATTSEQAKKTTLVDKMMAKTLETDTRARSLGRVKDILCYDPLVAIYILVAVFYMVWQSIGVAKGLSADDCGGGLAHFVSVSLMCGGSFIMIGGMTFACSLCCLVRKW
ncbi:hypothetical protein ACHAXA_010407 [Cyclostephanos tholiformis]|uniref:Uncharacterized protein n=1 Tax=Cyclostephanos tholiformis TaxID=382380 RepID=A0ABD3SFH0_9STRA